jgi:hypothetical protein
MKKTLAAILLALTAPAALAAGFGLDLRLGTTGLGVEAVQKLTPNFDLRFGMHGLGYSISYTYEDVDYDVDQSIAMPVVFLDWRPMAGKFRMSLGAAYYNNVLNLEATPDSTTLYSIGNGSYLGSDIGVLSGKATYHTGAPYAGVGWDFLFGQKQGFGLTVDVGALYRERADVTLNSSNVVVSDADLAAEARSIRGDMAKYHLLVNVGAAIRF